MLGYRYVGIKVSYLLTLRWISGWVHVITRVLINGRGGQKDRRVKDGSGRPFFKQDIVWFGIYRGP